jgi:hypothetical protein
MYDAKRARRVDRTRLTVTLPDAGLNRLPSEQSARAFGVSEQRQSPDITVSQDTEAS